MESRAGGVRVGVVRLVVRGPGGVVVIGMVVNGYDHMGTGGEVADAPWPATKVLLFSAILADLNANAGPGAGFTPIPA